MLQAHVKNGGDPYASHVVENLLQLSVPICKVVVVGVVVVEFYKALIEDRLGWISVRQMNATGG